MFFTIATIFLIVFYFREKIKDQEAVYAIKRQEQINESKQRDKIVELDDDKGCFQIN